MQEVSTCPFSNEFLQSKILMSSRYKFLKVVMKIQLVNKLLFEKEIF